MRPVEFRTYGLKCLDGLTRIVIAHCPHDMGNSGRQTTRLKEVFNCGRYGRFVWANKLNGNAIYKEITLDEYHTNG